MVSNRISMASNDILLTNHLHETTWIMIELLQFFTQSHDNLAGAAFEKWRVSVLCVARQPLA